MWGSTGSLSRMTGRFAPTPSGRMHLGNAYAMLAAWLDARSRGERMVLRIEDIDTPRVLPDADRWIMDDLAWLGLDWDGEPVYQSSPDRQARYREALECLTSVKTVSTVTASTMTVPAETVPAVTVPAVTVPAETVPAEATSSPDSEPHPLIYPCFCSRADLRAASAPQEGDGFQIYPGTCRRLRRDHPDRVRARLMRGDRHSLRIAMPERSAPGTDTANVSDGAAEGFAGITFDDQVYGTQHFNLVQDIGDSVIRRSDGLFAYQFVVTVDDLDMGVDAIVRGRDLLRSTALQGWIRSCLLRHGFVPQTSPLPSIVTPACPRYAHLPLIDNAAGRRLAKRERSLDLGTLRARGVTPEQAVGCCAWLLRLIPQPQPCRPQELLQHFSWNPLHAHHPDRALDPADPSCPVWLADALRA